MRARRALTLSITRKARAGDSIRSPSNRSRAFRSASGQCECGSDGKLATATAEFSVWKVSVMRKSALGHSESDEAAAGVTCFRLPASLNPDLGLVVVCISEFQVVDVRFNFDSCTFVTGNKLTVDHLARSPNALCLSGVTWHESQ